MATSENTIRIINYLKEHNGEDVTAADVAAALDLSKKAVDCTFTSAVCRKGLGQRSEAVEVEYEDGTRANVKFLSLNDAGMAFDPAAAE